MNAYSGSSYSSGTGYSREVYASSAYQSQLEQVVMDSREVKQDSPIMSSYSMGTYMNKRTPQEYFKADDFLINGRPETEFIQDLEEVKQHISKAFKATTNEELPQNLQINLLNQDQLRQVHIDIDGTWDEGIQGFSLNKQGKGVNEIFVKKDFLDRMMLTIGHEIGHVMSLTLSDKRDEEAKAFAFSIAWMQKIVDNNIAGLKQCINPVPARNGLHNVAYEFVVSLLERGMKAMNVFTDLVFGRITIMNKLEVIQI